MARKVRYLPPFGRGRQMWKNPLKPKPVEPVGGIEVVESVKEKPLTAQAQPAPKHVGNIDVVNAPGLVDKDVPTESTPKPEKVIEKVVEPESETKTEPTLIRVRAHEEDGTFTADDPSTPDVDEAFIDSGPVSYDKKTKKELLALADEMGLKGLSMADTKKSIVATITAAE